MEDRRGAPTSENPAFVADDGRARGMLRAVLAAVISASLVALVRLEQTRRRAAPLTDGRGDGARRSRFGGRAATAPNAAAAPSDPENVSMPDQAAEPQEYAVSALAAQLAAQAEETGRLRERLAAAEQRAESAEAAACEAERRRWSEAAVADRFVGLLEERLRAAEREAARLAVERSALGAEFARLWAARGDRAGSG
jgi:hypothetical protein